MKSMIIAVAMLLMPLAGWGQNEPAPDAVPAGQQEAVDKDFERKIEKLIEKYQNADPMADAQSDYKKIGVKLIAMMGVRPGITSHEETEITVAFEEMTIPETGDVIFSEKHNEFQSVAWDYARRYNKAMLMLIKGQTPEPVND